ncbi:MAG: hypothetical protein PVI51_06935 [candidate division WOR-3 bacterium]|jgi:hypothetical protein
MHRYLLLFLLVAFGSASVLVVNGDFEQPLTDGWSETMSGAGVMEITRGIGYDPDPDYEVYLHKGDGTGNVEITQLTYVPTTDLQFSVDAKLYAYGTSAQCWSGSGICLYYLNSTDDVLGWSRICARTVACPWTSSSTTHAIEATDTLWHTYSFNLNDELDYVPGVNRQEIAKVLVSVIAQCVDD